MERVKNRGNNFSESKSAPEGVSLPKPNISMRIAAPFIAVFACLSLLMTGFSLADPNPDASPSPNVTAPSASPAAATPNARPPAVAPKKPSASTYGPGQILVDPSGIHVGKDISISLGQDNRGVVWFAQLIGLIAIAAPFVTMVAIFGIILYFRHRRRVILHETLRTMVEKGQPIPPELLAGRVDAGAVGRPRSASGDLRNGLVLVCVGAALFYLHGKWGLIPFAIGLALLIVSAFERWEKNKPGTNS
jgi:hypothetical protein